MTCIAKPNRREPLRGSLSRGLLCGASLVATMVALGAPSPVEAEDRYWDANRTVVGSGGSGVWNLGDLTWSPSSDGVSGPYVAPWNNGALDNAIFGGTAGTVTLGTPITVHDLTFNSAGYILSGDTLTLGGATPVVTTNSGNTTINSVVVGAAGLTKAGAGGLLLNGANTFTGDIFLNAGSLYAGSDAALGNVANQIFTAAATQVRLSIAGAATGRTVTLGDGGVLILEGTGAGSALITGNGSVRAASRDVTLSNDASTYTGQTVFSGCNGVCSTRFTSIGNLGEASALGAPITVADGTIVFNQSSQYTDSVIYLGDGDSSNRNWDINGAGAYIRNQGTGALVLTGDIDVSAGGVFSAESADIELLGVLSGGNIGFSSSAGHSVTLGSANTYAGTTAVSGLVKASKLADAGWASSFGAGSTTTLNAGLVSYTGVGDSSDRLWTVNGAAGISNDGGGALALSGDVTFAPGGAVDSLTLGGGFAGENRFDGVIGGAGNLIADGAGTWILGGANTFAGSVTVNSGVLQAGSASAFGNTSGFTVNGGTLDLGGYDLIAPVLGGTGGTIALGANTLTVNAKTVQTFGGALTGAGGLTKIGAGTLTLTGQSSYTGATTIGGGVLSLNFAGAGGPTDDILSGSSPLILSGGVLDVIGAAGESNSQTFSATTITAGSTTVRASSGAGGALNLDLGAIVRTGGLVDFLLPGVGAISTANADGVLGGWATVNGSDYAKVAGGDIVAFDAADYTDKDDAGTWSTGDIVSDTDGAADSPFFGTVAADVQLGGLRYTAASDSVVTVAAGQTLGIDGTIIVAPSVGAGNLTITGGSLTGGAGGGVLGVRQNGSGLLTIASAIVDNGAGTSFVKGGDGAVRLAGANTYTGGTTLSGGRLAITSLADGGLASSLGASSADSANLVLESGTLAYGGATDASTDRGFTLVNGGATNPAIEVNAGRTIEFSGLVTSPDDAGLTKTGWGTLVLSNAANDYVGVTTITGGGGSSNSTLSVNTLTNGGSASGIGAASRDSANLVLSDGGRLQYTGATTAIDRGFTLASGNGGIDVAQATTTLTVSGVATGPGGFAKDGDGVLVLAGNNTYAGDTVVNGGTLRAGSATAFGPGGRLMTVNAGATLDLGGFNVAAGGLIGSGLVDLGANTLTTAGLSAVFSGRMTGTGGFTRGAGGFTQTLSGCDSDYTGVTTVAGNLTVDCLADGGVASAIGASSNASGNLVLAGGWFAYTGVSVSTDRGFTAGAGHAWINVANAATTLEFEGAAIGAGGLIKAGVGALVLSGANTYGGETQVREGVLRAGSSQAFGAPAAMTLYNVAGVELDLAGYDTSVAYLHGGGAIGGVVRLGGGDLTITTGNNSGGINYAGRITGVGDLIKNGGATQRLSGCGSDYSGTTTINGGALEVTCLADGGSASSIGASSASADSLVLNGGTLRYVGAGGATDRQFTLGAASGALDASGAGAIHFTSTDALTFAGANTAQTLTLTGVNTGDNTFAGRITNNETGVTSLTKTGTGAWNLTNSASDYTGVTRINGGVLGVDKLANGGFASSIGASSAAALNLIIGNGSTLRYTGDGDVTNRLFTLSSGVTFIESSGAGAIVFTDVGPVTLANNNQARTIALGGTNTGGNTLAGSIGDAGTGVTTFAKNDSGTWILTGDHTYSGTTNINAGVLHLGNGGETGSITSAIVNNFGSLVFNRSDTMTYGGAIHGTGSVRQAGSGATVLTGTNFYTGGTTIADGVLQLGDGGATGSILGDVLNDGILSFSRSNTYVFDGLVSGTGTVTQDGTGMTILTADNTYTGGTTITAGTLQVGAGGTSGGIVGDVVNNGVLAINRSDSVLFEGLISGSGRFEQRGTGTTILTAGNTYTGGTTISAGVLQIGDGGSTGGVVGTIVNNGALRLTRAGELSLAGAISGSGALTQAGPGVVVLSGANSYRGATDVVAGALLVNGDQSVATGLTSVFSGAALGGFGVIGGDVTLADNAVLTPGAGGAGTLTINGDLSLAADTQLNFEFGEADVVGGALNDLVNVGGDLILDGALNVAETAGGTFGAGVYRVFNYGGALTDNGLSVGTSPSGSQLVVQTSVAGQVNLVNSAGLTLNFWDGSAGPKYDGVVNGGDGVWQSSAGNNNWTGSTGAVNAGYTDAAYAIFMGEGGVVTIDGGLGAVSASGMQIAADGYVITGDALTLTDAQSVIRVGDGSVDGAAFVARIEAELAGAAQLVKTDAGTLVLAGANSFTGGARIEGGVISISSDANLGAASGDISLDGGALRTTADLISARDVALDGDGVLWADAATHFNLDGRIDGLGALTKAGGGTLTLTNANSYAGGTTIEGGVLQLGDGGTTGSVIGDVLNDGVLAVNRSDAVTLEGIISGAGSFVQAGSGTTFLTAANLYAGGTTIANGVLSIGNGGTSGSIVGDVTTDGVLAFDRADDIVFGGVVSGAGQIEQRGAGTSILTGDSSGFGGRTSVLNGALLVNAALGGGVDVRTGGRLGGFGIILGDVLVDNGGHLDPGDQGDAPGVLTIGGDLAFDAGAALNISLGQADVIGGPLNDLVEVDGDLVLDGTLDVTIPAGGSFAPGLYRVINYAGVLTDNGLAIGSIPSPDFYVQTSVANQVNLVNTSGLQFRYWDGVGTKNDGVIDGGDGLWQRSVGNDNWVDDGSIPNAQFADTAFAVFMGRAGEVTVDDSLGGVEASGMQFLTDGYVIAGAAIHLTGATGSVIRTGDGTTAGAGVTAVIGSEILGASQLIKADLGTLILSGANGYVGGTAIDGGILQVSSDANLGAAAGGLSFDGGALRTTADLTSSREVVFEGAGGFLTDAGTTLTLNGVMSGDGGFTKEGAGDLILTGANGFGGATTIASGGLFVRGDQSAATGRTTVADGARLGGDGVIGGDVVLADGAVLSAGIEGAGTLTINGDLGLEAGSILDFQFGQANVAGGAFNDLVNVRGDLVLDGIINVSTTTGGAFGPGVYRVFNYGGTLTDNGLTLGSLLAGGDVAVQTSIGGQVNLVNSAGLTLNFWDGNAGPKNNNLIDGGDGVWRVGGGGTNWTEASGAVNADYAQDSFVVFSAEPGTVTVDNSGGAVLTSGMQFASDGYFVAGDSLTLTGAQTTIQVGDGSTAGVDYTATIASVLTGGAMLVKTDIGTLNLTGINTYTGGTAINGGVVRIGDDANLGDAAGGLSFSGGTLNTLADITSGRTISLAGSGAFLTDAGTTLTLTGALSGPGRLIKDGAGTLVLDGTGGQTGGFSVDAGALMVNGDYSTATGLGRVAGGATLGGVGVIGADVIIANGGILSPGAGAAGTLTINGDLSLSAESRLAFELGGANIPGGGLNDLVNVGGDLVLDGVLDVTVPALGAFDVGVYRLFNYAGALTDNGLTLGSLPGEGERSVQTAILGQVNLVNSAGLTLRYWDGAAGPKNDGVINGGDGQWQSSDGNDHWTDADGALNASFTDAAFAVFGGAAGTVTIDNSLGQVTAGGMQFATDGYVVTGDNLLLTEAQSVIRVGDGSTDAAGFTATIDAVLKGEGQLVKTDAGLLILGGANTYAGGTLIAGGTVQISSDANLGAIDGAVTLDGGALATTADLISARDIVLNGAGGISTASDTTFTFDGLFSGSGALTKTGAGALVVTGDSSGFTGVTRVAEGVLTLQGALGGGVGVAGGARMEGVGWMAGLSNAGVVAPGQDGIFGTLTVTGDYLGAGGVLEIDAELGGDASPTDRLSIGGNATGSTEVVVTNVGGLGGQTTQGIKIIDVAGVSSATFSLKGDYLFQGEQAVIAGAYGYRLYKGGVSSPADGDWYLRSSVLNPVDPLDPTEPEGPLYQPGVPLYEIYGANLQAINGLPTFQQRVGGRAWAAGASPERGGVWGRVEGALARERAEVSTSRVDHDLNSWKVQMGVDKVLADASGGRLVAGLTAHYGEAYSEVRSVFGGGVLDTDGYGLGATLSWQGLEGLYIDGQAQFSWYQSDVESSVLGDLAANHNGWGEAASVEVGKRLRLGENSSITPQAQVVYSGARFDDFSDPAGADVSTDQGRSLRTRVGVSIDRDETWEGGSGHVYAIANVFYEWMDPARVDVSGALIEHANERLRGELGIGFSATWREGVTFYGETSVAGGVEDLGDSRSVKASGGIRIAF